jgi:hypothetical protein
VEALAIVENLDVLEDGGPQLEAGSPATLVDELGLDSCEEALGYGVVPTVALAAHADVDTQVGEGTSVLLTRVLATAVGVVKQ